MNKLLPLLCVMLYAVSASAQFQKVPADQVSVVATNFSHISGTNAQQVFESIDGALTNAVIVTGTNQTLATTSTVTSAFGYVDISSTNGDVTLTSVDQIAPGQDNQVVVLYGSSNTNTVTISSRDNIVLFQGVSFTLGNDDQLELVYRINKWFERRRVDFY